MCWWPFDRLEEYREWRKHRKTRALAARLLLTARAYARRTNSQVIVITETPEGYKVSRYRCSEDDALVRFHICWELLLRKHMLRKQQATADRINAGVLN